MKKFLLSVIVLFSFLSINAQSDSTMQKYIGKYKFPDGSPVTEINVTIESGILTATSAMGTTELKKMETENVFEIVVYGGTATFKKDTEGKITGVQIVVGDLNMEGVKAEEHLMTNLLEMGYIRHK